MNKNGGIRPDLQKILDDVETWRDTYITLKAHNSMQEKLIQHLNLEINKFKRDIKLLTNKISVVEKTSQSQINTLKSEKECLRIELDDTKNECNRLRTENVTCNQDDEIFKLRTELKSLRYESTVQTDEYNKKLQTKSEELSKCQGLLETATSKLGAMAIQYNIQMNQQLNEKKNSKSSGSAKKKTQAPRWPKLNISNDPGDEDDFENVISLRNEKTKTPSAGKKRKLFREDQHEVVDV